MQTLHRLLATLLLVVASTLLALGLGEVGMRITGAVEGIDYTMYPQEIHRPDRLPVGLFANPPRSYPAFRPGASGVATTSDYSVVYTINSKGLRDGEHSYAHGEETIRVVALGDSFTFGQGVDYGARFTEVAEAALPGVDVVNMGVPGYGLDEALMAFLIEGRRYAPEVVVVFLNGPMSSRARVQLSEIDGRFQLPDHLASALDEQGPTRETLYLAQSNPFFQEKTPWLVRHSYLLSFVSYRLTLWRLHDMLRDEDARFWKAPVTDGAPPTPMRDPRRMKRMTLLLEALRDAATENGARVIVVNIDAQQRFDHVRDIPGITYVDLADELSRRARDHDLRFTFDRHYNADTHAFIGGRLSEILRASP